MNDNKSADSPVHGEAASTALALPISKLRGVPPQARTALKRRRINTCGRLLEEAGDAGKRAALAQAARIEPPLLEQLVQRADMARVKGVGAVFCLMLEEVGVRDVAALAAQEPAELCERLREWNAQERLARRSPTPEEVEAWVDQARQLPILVRY
ncbi:DUF4332 domain-containing protein [Geminicoccaceae bacterium 1502E]|nr:DUF4332 domain-containing protein [Geminicoccaceae bacterium 1502E]